MAKKNIKLVIESYCLVIEFSYRHTIMITKKYSKGADDLNLGIETETLEFRKSTGELKEAVQSICVILNKHQHGELFFGVKPDGTVIGQVVTAESLREVSQKIKNSPLRYF